jgi:zinc protease
MPRLRFRSLLPAVLVACVLLPWTAPVATAATAPAPARGVPKEIAVKTLRNGLTIIVWPDHDIPSVALYNWFRVGSRNEQPGLTGLSHFFEHMMFNGAKGTKPGEFDRIMSEHGGSNNAFTTNDVTCYQDWFPRSALETIFRMEGDRLCCLAIDSTVVESERGVVSSERRVSVDDDNRGSLDEQVQSMSFLAHPYNIPVIGWPSDIERWKLRDLKEYFRVHYAPNNATLVVVGDVTPAEIFALAEKHIGPIAAQPPPPEVTTIEPPQAGERRLTMRRPGQVPLIQVAYHVGPAHGADFEAEDLLRTILTTGESSRLYRRMVDQDRVALDVSSYFARGFDPGLLHFQVTVSPEKGAAAAESALFDELSRVARDGVSVAELTKAKNVRLAAYWRSLKTIDGKASELGEFQTFQGDWRRLFSAPDRYNKVTRAQIQALARRVFAERNRNIGVLIPEDPRTAKAADAPKGGAR